MKSLALCMIVKNEEEMLGGCLESIKDWVDEMIVVDTGSTDNTKQIALEHGAKVFDFEWVNDFAAARNFSKAQTNCDYVIALDADERFHGEDGEKLRSDLNNTEFRVGFIKLTHATSIHDKCDEVLKTSNRNDSTTYLPRVLLNTPDNVWMGRIHESPEIINARYFSANVVHLGGDIEYRKIRKKSERNLELLELANKDEVERSPIFYHYLAYERYVSGDVAGYISALKQGWDIALEYAESAESENKIQLANTGIVANYPAALLSQGKFEEGMQALNLLVQNLSTFSTNYCNTIHLALTACLKVNLPEQIQDEFYQLVYSCSEFLAASKGAVFSEPTYESLTSTKAVNYQLLALIKLKRFDEAQEVFAKAKEEYAHKDLYAMELMEIEFLISSGDLQNALLRYTEVSEKDFNRSSDIWILGSLLLLALNQEELSFEYLDRVYENINKGLVGVHREHLFNRLTVRRDVLQVNPRTGGGPYGVLGAILSRQPVGSHHSVLRSQIDNVIERYVEVGKVEQLLPFFDHRAEQILPGIKDLVKEKLVSLGFELEDDGVKAPIICLGYGLDEIKSLFENSSKFSIIEFSEDDVSTIEASADSALDDLLFGDLDFGGDDGPYSDAHKIFQNKFSDCEGTPVVLWNNAWPFDIANEIFPGRQSIFYVGDTSKVINDSSSLRVWHEEYSSLLSQIGGGMFYLNSKLLSEKPRHTLQRLFAFTGIEYSEEVEQSLTDVSWVEFDIDEKFTDEQDQKILRTWKLV